MAMEPVQVLAAMVCGDAGLRLTWAWAPPIPTLVWTLYETVPWTRSVIEPRLVLASMAAVVQQDRAAEVFAAGGVLEGPLPPIRDLRLWAGGIGGGSLAL